mgnify:CR=1 FL=1
MTKSFAVATLSRSTTTTAMTLGLKLADSEEEARASAYADQLPARPEDSWSHKTLAAEIPVASIPEVQARDERIATLEAALFVKPAPTEVVVPIAVIERDGLVFMVKRSADTLRPSMWEFPGGKVEEQDLEGGAPTDHPVLVRALRRELREELAVTDARVGEAVGSCLFSWRTSVRICALRVDLGHWEPGSSVSYEHGWFDLDHALDHLPCVPSFYNLYAALKAAIPR